MKAARDNNGKPQLGYLLDYPIANEAFARVMEIGAVKYEKDNWKIGGKPDEEYLDACLRHLHLHKQGLFASDTGCLHLAHARWNIDTLIELNIQRTVDWDVFDEQLEYWRSQK